MLARFVIGRALAGRPVLERFSFRETIVSPVGIPRRDASDFDCSDRSVAISSAVYATLLFIIPLPWVAHFVALATTSSWHRQIRLAIFERE